MSEQLSGRYFGQGSPLFWLVMKTSFLTLITLGIYRFWAKTRIRKYIWSATAAAEDSFEYTGTGIEKFLGFLVAIVVLAIYLGIAQMILLFFGLSLITDANTTAGSIVQGVTINLPLLVVMPLILFAQYRARRYKMARTRWRGIRFGMENAAWGFVLRAIGHYFLTIVTLGILLPRQTFYLEKYATDRTWFGDAKFEQSGDWKRLYPGMKHLLIGVGFWSVGFGLFMILDVIQLGVILMLAGYVWGLVGFLYYRIYALNYLTRNKILDSQIAFESVASTKTVAVTAIIGGVVIGLTGAIAIGIYGAVGAGLFSFSIPQEPEDIFGPTMVILAIGGAVLMVFLLLMLRALSLVWITQPIIAHVVDNVTMLGSERLNNIQQRSADLGADAEGFADALDIGGAI